MKTLDERIKRAKKRADDALTVAIIALFLIGGAYVLSIAYGVSYGNLIQNNAIIANNQNQLLKSEIYDALMNVSSGYSVTIVQNGTFEWISAPSTTPLQISNYTLKYVQIGPLGFNLLILNPPTTPLNILTGSGWSFRLQNFVPVVNQLLLLEQGQQTAYVGPSLLRLTSANAKKMQITGDCLNNNYTGIGPISSGMCVVSGTAGDYGLTPGLNALRVDRVDYLVASTYSFYAVVTNLPSSLTINQNFTLTSPWELVLPSV